MDSWVETIEERTLSLDDLQMYVFGMKFRLRFIESKGQEFEDLFNKVMNYLYLSDFVSVKAHGKIGDMKSDGYLKSEKTIYQCYAPSSIRDSEFRSKIENDFEGAKAHWGDKMSRWRIVHNSTDGLPPNSSQKLIELDSSHPDIRIDQLKYEEFRELILQLRIDQLVEILGPVPDSATFNRLGMEELTQVVEAIAEREPLETQIIVPPPIEKLNRNRLSEDAKGLLQQGRSRYNLVKDFFENHPDTELGERIAQGFREEYAELKSKSLSPEFIFMKLQNFTGGMGGKPVHQVAVLAILSYFFDSCDIFEPGSDLGLQETVHDSTD